MVDINLHSCKECDNFFRCNHTVDVLTSSSFLHAFIFIESHSSSASITMKYSSTSYSQIHVATSVCWHPKTWQRLHWHKIRGITLTGYKYHGTDGESSESDRESL